MDEDPLEPYGKVKYLEGPADQKSFGLLLPWKDHNRTERQGMGKKS